MATKNRIKAAIPEVDRRSVRKDSRKSKRAASRTDKAYAAQKSVCCKHHPKAHDDNGCIIGGCACITPEHLALVGIVRTKRKTPKKRKRDPRPLVSIEDLQKTRRLQKELLGIENYSPEEIAVLLVNRK